MHLVSSLSKKNTLFHEEYYKVSLLRHFDQYQLSPDYGGVAAVEYDITGLRQTNNLAEFIGSYLDVSQLKDN